MGSDQSLLRDRSEAYLRYMTRRREARELVEPWLADLTDQIVHLDDITSDAIAQAKEWREVYPEARQAAWDWEKVVKTFRRRPRHVELAIWVDQILCGLVVGRISDRCIVATIHYLEGRPVDNPLSGSVAAIATRYVDILALLVNCKQTAIDSPLPALVDFYKGLGYSSATTKGKKVVRLAKTLRAS